MATFKTLSSADIKTTRSTLNQLIDFVEEDISGSSTNTRKKYQTFITSSGDNAITSSIFHTVFDQNYTLQTANEIFDMTIGCKKDATEVTGSSTGTDINGKMLFASESLMMREKLGNYSQYAQVLLGSAQKQFYAPGVNAFDSSKSSNSAEGITGDRIEQALFLNFRRLFARDEIKKETFAMRLFQSATFDSFDYWINLYFYY